MNKDQLREAILGTAAWNKAGFITESAAPAQEQEILEESSEEVAEAHVCPLCESHLEEELSDEQLLEHAGAMYQTFQEAEQLLAEAEEAEDGDVIEEEEEVDLLEGLDDEELEDVVDLIEAYKMKKAKKGKKGMDSGEAC
jgi:DNA repair exonuclease SbcCD ATPase subunit